MDIKSMQDIINNFLMMFPQHYFSSVLQKSFDYRMPG